MTVKEALDLAKKSKAVAADLRFCDFLGTWQHCTFPISEIDEGVFEDGLGFDGSSIRGWQPIRLAAECRDPAVIVVILPTEG